MEKSCFKCKTEFTEDEKSKKSSYCKNCRTQISRERRKYNPKRANEIGEKSRKKYLANNRKVVNRTKAENRKQKLKEWKANGDPLDRAYMDWPNQRKREAA